MMIKRHANALFAIDRDLQIRQLEQGRAVACYNQALGVILE